MLAEGAACPCPAGAEGNGGPLPSPVLSKPQGLSLVQLRRGGKRRGLETSTCWGSARRRNLPVSGCGALTQGLCVVLQEKEKKPLKEGVQDMLVKHHLFSWDIDG